MVQKKTGSIVLLLVLGLVSACAGTYKVTSSSQADARKDVDDCIELLQAPGGDKTAALSCMQWVASPTAGELEKARVAIEPLLYGDNVLLSVQAFDVLAALRAKGAGSSVDSLLTRPDTCQRMAARLMTLWKNAAGSTKRHILYHIMHQTCVPFAPWAWEQMADRAVGFDAESALTRWVMEHSDDGAVGRLLDILTSKGQSPEKRGSLAVILSTKPLNVAQKKRALMVFDKALIAEKSRRKLGNKLVGTRPLLPFESMLSIFGQVAVPKSVLQQVEEIILREYINDQLRGNPGQLALAFTAQGAPAALKLAALKALGPLDDKLAHEMLLPLVKSQKEDTAVRTTALELLDAHWNKSLSELSGEICENEFSSPVCESALALLKKHDNRSFRTLQKTVIVQKRAEEAAQGFENCSSLGSCLEVYKKLDKTAFKLMSLDHRLLANAAVALAVADHAFATYVGRENLQAYNQAMRLMAESVARALRQFQSGYYGGGVPSFNQEALDAMKALMSAGMKKHGDLIVGAAGLVYFTRCSIKDAKLLKRLDDFTSNSYSDTFFFIRINEGEIKEQLKGKCEPLDDPEFYKNLKKLKKFQ